jgi:uncharacterized membrane protein YfcA
MENTNLNTVITNSLSYLKNKTVLFQKDLLIYLLSLISGLFLGGLFGTFLPFFRTKIIWDGLILLIVLGSVEILNSLFYTKKQNVRFLKILNFLKIGLLLGFFIDAFKVGS